MAGWHPGDGEVQGSLACCSPRGCKESDTTEQLNGLVSQNNVVQLPANSVMESEAGSPSLDPPAERQHQAASSLAGRQRHVSVA